VVIVWIVLIIFVILSISVPLLIRVIYWNPQRRHRETPEKFGISFEEVWFPTRNRCQLYGWWIPAPAYDTDNPGPTIILIHGWGRNVERMLAYIQALHPRDYHLLAFDARNHGSSGRDGYSTMVKFAEDISAAVDFVCLQPVVEPERIGVVGLSIGGSAALYAAACDPRLKAVVTVGAFAHPASIMRREFQRRRIPYFPFVWLILRYVERQVGLKLDQIAPVNNIAKIKAPVFLIHGEADEVVPVSEGREMLAAGGTAHVQLWSLPGYGHSDPHQHPEFWEKVTTFFDQALQPLRAESQLE
jgi:dipeptidyl aminopeptidase/acylaminoacyl peptidase